MTEFLPAIRHLHIGAVCVSLALFFFRGLLMLGDITWRRHRLLRMVPPMVDTVLLASAIALAALLRQYPFVHAWMTVKVLAVLLYIGLGMVAIRHGRTRRTRALAFVAALLTAAFIVSVARSHDPRGFFVLLGWAHTA